MRRLFFPLGVCLSFWSVPLAFAGGPLQPPLFIDTSYGRFTGDTTLSLGLGGVLSGQASRALLDVRARFLDTAGLVFGYEEGGLFHASADPRRVFSWGVELRPLFLLRWTQGWELGLPRTDLTLDSLSLELRALHSQPVEEGRGKLGVLLGLGVEMPVTGGVNGLWIGWQGGIRWIDPLLPGQEGLHPTGYLSMTLSWHQLVRSGLLSPHKVTLAF